MILSSLQVPRELRPLEAVRSSASSKVEYLSSDLAIHRQYSVAFLDRREFSRSASGIEPENTVFYLVLGPMAVTMHDRLDILEFPSNSLFDIGRRSAFSGMVHSYPKASSFNCVDLWKLAPNFWSIDVAIYASEFAKLAEVVDELFTGEIACVDKQICM